MPFSFLFLTTLISLTDTSAWTALSFGQGTPNTVLFQEEHLEIRVEKSASPLLHLFTARRSVTSLKVKGRVRGDWRFPTGPSWDQSPDDALLRIGLIENGERRLNMLERLAAPDWIKQIETQSSSTADGIGKIHCFHLMPDEKWLGATRENPNADIFIETIQSVPGDDGSFEMSILLDAPIDTAGLWLLADGDDTEASFTVEIEKIEIGMAP